MECTIHGCRTPKGSPGYVPMLLAEVPNDAVSWVKVGPDTTVVMFEHMKKFSCLSVLRAVLVQIEQ